MAHRGASAFAPENTIEAIEKAFELGADGIETDVQMSRDGELFIFHDWTLDRIAGDGTLFTEKKSSEIKGYDAGSWFSGKFAGAEIPLLSEALSAVPEGKTINIEIKKTARDEREIEKKLLKCIRDSGHFSNIIVSSFNHKSVALIRSLEPELKTALIVSSLFADPMRYFGDFSCYSIHPAFFYVDRQLVDVLHSNNIKIYPWVVDIPSYAKVLTDMGCDGIISNNPSISF